MAKTAESTPILLGTFADQESAENARQSLEEAGFSSDHLAIMPRFPALPETDARRSGGKGAIVGALFGGAVGFFLSAMRSMVVEGVSNADATVNIIGTALAGSFAGAAAIGIIGAMSGSNVRNHEQSTEGSLVDPDYLLLAKDLSEGEELVRMQEILRGPSSSVPG